MIEEHLKNKLGEINKDLLENYSKVNNVGVLSGLSGISLFFFYCSRFLKDDDLFDMGITAIEDCVQMINEKSAPTTYFNGVVGFGWVLDHLEKEGFIEFDCDGFFYGIDDNLSTTMFGAMKSKNYDFINGAIGYALFFLCRYRNTKSSNLKEKYKGILLRFIALLKDNGEEDYDTIKWLSITDIETQERGYNLSLSHGISSIIAILTKFCEFDDLKLYARPMLLKAVNYLIGSKNTSDRLFCFFPNSVPLTGKIRYNSRLAWCYGDLGIGITLWKAAKVLGNQELETISLSILEHASQRTDPYVTMVDEPTICHGAFGNSLVFNKIYKNTSEGKFRKASSYWTHCKKRA